MSENYSLNDNNNQEEDLLKDMNEFDKKTKNLLKERKVQLHDNLTHFAKDLEKEEDFDSFILNQVDDICGISQDFKDCVNQCCAFIAIKVIGTIFMTLYFIGILEIIGVLNTIKEEISSSFKLIFLDQKRETSFYQNYINENLKMPSFDLFFLSAIVSDFFSNLLTFPVTVILIFLANSSIIFFGLEYFDFRKGEFLNNKYSYKENLYLIGIYLSLYLLLGIVALYPHELLKRAYLLYDFKKRNRDITMNGHIFVYLFSMVVSSIAKILLDRHFVFDKVKLIINKQNTDSFFTYNFYIVLIYASSMICSLFFYLIYSCFFKDIKKENDNTSVEVIKVFGYMIYIETISGSCCSDCCIATEKCGLCLGCYASNCFKCCDCCDCFDTNEAYEGKRKLCVIYKIKGICSWIFDLLAAKEMFFIVSTLYIFEFINLGFKPELSKYLNSASERDISKTNIISFISIIILYFLNLLIGFSFMTFCTLGKNVIKFNEKYANREYNKSEITYINIGIVLFSLLICIINTILSGLFYFWNSKNMMYYFISFSVSTNEYANIIFMYFAEADFLNFDLINKSFAISFYQIVFNIFKSICFFKCGNETLILIQFIFGCCFIFFYLMVILFSSLTYKYI